MDLRKLVLVCPECKAEFDELKKYGMTVNTGYTMIEEGDIEHPDCDLDDPEKRSYCCPMCGYESPDADTFLALS